MNEGMSHAPGYIFDWVEQLGFGELTASQQQEVLQYIPRAEYDDMHAAAADLKRRNRKEQVPGREDIKQNLLQHMQQVHQPPRRKTISLRRANQVWKAAAIILFMISCGLGYYVTFESRSAVAEVIRITDTVYAAAALPVAPVQYDTIYITKAKDEQKKRRKQSAAPHAATAVAKTAQFVAEPSTLVMTPEQYRQRANTGKGSSIGGDTMVQKYAFVTL